MQTQTMTLNIQLPVTNIYCYQDVVEAISHLFSETLYEYIIFDLQFLTRRSVFLRLPSMRADATVPPR